MATTDTDTARGRAARRLQLVERLGRVDLALLQWEEWQDEQEWPPERRREVPTPARGYADLKALRARVIAQLAKGRLRRAG